MPDPETMAVPETSPNGGLPMMDVATRDNPAPLETFYRERTAGQYPIPYDELTVRKGLRIFDAMYATDETIAYAHNLARMVRLSTGWNLAPPTDKEGKPKPGAEAVADHVQEIIEKFDRWDEFLFQLLDGTRQGFKLGEIVTREGKVGGKRAWVLDDILVRNSRWFRFDVDGAGRIKPDGILEYTLNNPDDGGIPGNWDPGQVRRHSPEKFVRFTWNPLDSNAYSLYGFSDFRSIYRAYFLGDVTLKGWGETLDTYRTPIVLAVARKGLTSVQRADFLDVMVRSMKRGGVVIPEEYLPQSMELDKCVKFHEVEGKADDFATLDAALDKKKMRGVMIGALVSDVGDKGKGSFALGQQHVMLFLNVLEMRGRALGRAVGQTLFRTLVRANLGEKAAELTPALQWPEAGDERATARSTIIKTLVEARVVDPTEPWVREFVGNLPPMDPEVEKVVLAERENRLKTAQIEPMDPREEMEMKAKGPPPEKASAEEPPQGKGDGLAGDDPERARAAALDVEAKVDVLSIQDRGADREDRYASALNRAWRDVFRDPKGGLASQVRVAIANPAVSEVPRIDAARVLEVYRRFVVETMVEGAVDGLREVNRGLARLGREALASAAEDNADGVPVAPAVATQVAGMDLYEFARRQGVDLDEEVGALARRINLNQADLDNFARLRIDEIRGEVEKQVARLREEARALVVDAKARGVKPGAALRREFRDLEEKWVGIESDLANESSALFDTLESSAYNEGRARLYEATPAGTVIGLLYSSVLDSRTTRFCQVWDGYMAPKGDPVWRTIVPPNHWRCRAIVVAVLAGERTVAEVEAAALRKPSEKPHAGFAGAKWMPPVPAMAGR